MYEVVFGAIMVFAGFILPLLLVFSIMACLAYSKTKAWRKEKSKHVATTGDVEMDPLVSEDEEEEALDSEEEAEITARKEAEKHDWDLTTYQKWKKELKNQWTGAAQMELAAKKEQEDRAKIAKQVAREMLRAQRKQERNKKSQGGKAQEAVEDALTGQEQEYGLPTYDVATASSS